MRKKLAILFGLVALSATPVRAMEMDYWRLGAGFGAAWCGVMVGAIVVYNFLHKSKSQPMSMWHRAASLGLGTVAVVSLDYAFNGRLSSSLGGLSPWR